MKGKIMKTLKINSVGKASDLTRGPQDGTEIEADFVLYRSMP